MASSSNPLPYSTLAQVEEDLVYLAEKVTAVISNFVPVKLSGDDNYPTWQSQMRNLMEGYNMLGIVDETSICPRAVSPIFEEQYDHIVKQWIYSTISEGLLASVVDLGSAKDVWEKLKFSHNLDMIRSHQAMLPPQTEINGEGTIDKTKMRRNKELCKSLMKATWYEVRSILRENEHLTTESINSDGNTVLHIAVGTVRNEIVEKLLLLITDVQLPEIRNSDGNTALHIAAIIGNTEAAKLLIQKSTRLLEIRNHKGETPLEKAYESMHLDTIEYLLNFKNDGGNTMQISSSLEESLSPNANIGVNLLVNAISAKQYEFATKLVKKYPEFVVETDNVLMAIARSFPSGLSSWEIFFYPIINMSFMCELIGEKTEEPVRIVVHTVKEYTKISNDDANICQIIMGWLYILILLMPFHILLQTGLLIFSLIPLLIMVVYFPFFLVYWVLWNIATRTVSPVKHIVQKKKEWDDAKEVLKLVCDQIDENDSPDAPRRYYIRPVLEAARQNAFDVVNEIFTRCPEAIRYKDESGYDIIQLALLNRSEKIYNLIYVIGERKNIYRTVEDSSKNNMLHLAGRLAPPHKLKQRTGAALQLQRELQWREEVKKLVFPTYITKENNSNETPDEVFTKAHEKLVKEGEQWMKAVANSCSITAALIITITFASAITVPGGSDQTTGIPVFTGESAFTVFAISDAISLFASTTSLLLFLSVLTGRFAEQDFLVSLPTRLIFGLSALILSTIALMVAFGATLYLVFCNKRPWTLAPICVSAFVPIACFGTLQIPLIVDLFRSRYISTFGQKSYIKSHTLNLNDIQSFFGL